MDSILYFEEISNHWSDALIVLRKDGLENSEVVLGHFVGYLVDDVNKFGIDWVLAHIKDRWLKALSDHIIPV